VSNHSLGPWMAVRSVPAEGFDCWWIMDGGTSIVADCPGYSPSGSAQSAANAHLIAAAPDLLAALQDMTSAMFTRPSCQCGAVDRCLCMKCASGRAFAAINLAQVGTAGEGER
jgi:hypothetical protein